MTCRLPSKPEMLSKLMPCHAEPQLPRNCPSTTANSTFRIWHRAPNASQLSFMVPVRASTCHLAGNRHHCDARVKTYIGQGDLQHIPRAANVIPGTGL